MDQMRHPTLAGFPPRFGNNYQTSKWLADKNREDILHAEQSQCYQYEWVEIQDL